MSELAVIENGNGRMVAAGPMFTPESKGLLRRTICKEASEDEFEWFVNQCERTRLDPFSKQIHPVMRRDTKRNINVMSIQTSIDGYRLVAERTGKYEGQTNVFWCGEDGVWKDVWLSKERPAAAKVGVYKTKCREPIWGVALWSEYAQTYRDGNPTQFWAKMGALMLGKCAESLALRKAFPQELSGIYTAEEMQQADHAPDTQDLPPPQQETYVEIIKRSKALRADMNKAFAACDTLACLKKEMGRVARIHGKEVWSRPTYHNETETFTDLAAQHKERVDGKEHRESPEGQAEWRDSVAKSSNATELLACVNVFQKTGYLNTMENEQALADKAIEMGYEDLADFLDKNAEPEAA